jgi:hypothetical protein
MASAFKVIELPVFSQAVLISRITQSELKQLVTSRKVLEELQASIDEAEASIQSRLEAGADVQPGLFSASLKKSPRRNVAWKDVVLRLAKRLEYEPETYCRRVLASTKPTITISPFHSSSHKSEPPRRSRISGARRVHRYTPMTTQRNSHPCTARAGQFAKMAACLIASPVLLPILIVKRILKRPSSAHKIYAAPEERRRWSENDRG